MTQKREFPAKLYGRLTKEGPKEWWALSYYHSNEHPQYPNAAVYKNATIGSKTTETTLTEEGLLYGLQSGNLVPKDGKEILAWGAEFCAQLERLGIGALMVYEGKGTVPSIYWLSDAEFAKLDADDEENWEGKDAAWRQSDGANIEAETRASVNGHWIFGPGGGKYTSLLSYIEEKAHCSQPRNVAAIAAELAQVNGMGIGALFHKYQPLT